MSDIAMTDWREHDEPCPVCGSRRRRAVGRRGGSAHRNSRGVETNVVRCRDCGLYYSHPTLLPAGNPYEAEEEDYFRIHDRDEKRANGRSIAAEAAALLGRRGSMLEIGCGRGDLLLGAREEGWVVRGIEMTSAFADEAEARGIPVERSPVESAVLLAEQTFDVILFPGVLEHLYRPLDVLRRARAALRPGGLVFVDVPNEASLALAAGNLYMRARGRDWSVNLSPTFAPFHVVGFTPRSLRRALAATGFEVVKMTQLRWRTELLQPRNLGERIEQAALGAASWLGAKLRRADGLCCWARAV